MEKASVFISNRSQAIRLPKSAALPEHVKRVDVVVLGNTRIISPEGESWDVWFDSPDKLTEDCFNDREQPIEQERDAF